jgi:hypothetical protein
MFHQSLTWRVVGGIILRLEVGGLLVSRIGGCLPGKGLLIHHSTERYIIKDIVKHTLVAIIKISACAKMDSFAEKIALEARSTEPIVRCISKESFRSSRPHPSKRRYIRRLRVEEKRTMMA